jgi:hypothetical protein
MAGNELPINSKIYRLFGLFNRAVMDMQYAYPHNPLLLLWAIFSGQLARALQSCCHRQPDGPAAEADKRSPMFTSAQNFSRNLVGAAGTLFFAGLCIAGATATPANA